MLLARATPTVSLHIPWDKCSDWSELRQTASSYGAPRNITASVSWKY